jgi:acylphosphatase
MSHVFRHQIIRQVVVRGRVQGVGFRAWTEAVALRRDLEGYVRNRRDGAVEALFAGPADVVAAMIEDCRRGPPGARVVSLDAQDGTADLLHLRYPGERFSLLPTV